jgi:hypothetical protein
MLPNGVPYLRKEITETQALIYKVPYS